MSEVVYLEKKIENAQLKDARRTRKALEKALRKHRLREERSAMPLSRVARASFRAKQLNELSADSAQALSAIASGLESIVSIRNSIAKLREKPMI